MPRGILLAFWAFETDFGQVQGDFNTANALVTLGHDCRRPELFQPQILAAISALRTGRDRPRPHHRRLGGRNRHGADAARTTFSNGAWTAMATALVS